MNGRTILLYGLERLARRHATRAESTWNTLKRRYRFEPQQRQRAEKILAAAYLRDNHPHALARLDGVEPGEDLRLHHKRILAALVAEDWERARFWIDELPAPERRMERWRPWLRF